ncbi:MAG: exonuclease SbcCD subunit D C-terminal domain-containing protein [Methylococcaceae bacterium]|nr:exonuclease SbcCD subunit D C-terminal domain-containing protein [Methylococcaceae bacterium]
MRIIHTSDWHLGQTLHGFDRTYEHQCFLDWLLSQLESEQADVLLVTGDVFDNANPSSSAQRQLYRFLQAARHRLPHLNIVLIAGNHDSPGRLEAPAPLLEVFGTVVVGQVGRRGEDEIEIEKLVIPLRDRSGQTRAWCLAVPFLRPGDVPRMDKGDAYLSGVAELYRQALEWALSCREPDQAVLAMGHCHMAGTGISSDSERRIVIGGAEMLPTGVFDDRIAYAALGHLHLAQSVGGQDWIRYSGSPLPMSFSETHYRHQVVRIDLADEKAGAIQAIPVPRFVELLRVPPQPQILSEVLAVLAELELEDLPEQQWPYLEVRVLYDGPEPGARPAVEAALAGKPVRLARIDPNHVRRQNDTAAETMAPLDDLGQLQPEDIFLGHYRNTYGGEAPEGLQKAFFELLLEPSEGADA